MITVSGAVTIILTLLGFGAVFGLLFFLIRYLRGKFPGESAAWFFTAAEIVLVVLAVLVLIGFVLHLMGYPVVSYTPLPH